MEVLVKILKGAYIYCYFLGELGILWGNVDEKYVSYNECVVIVVVFLPLWV